jgi:hypothetical protein
MLKIWNGSQWVLAKLMVNASGTFVTGVLKRWSGSAWIVVSTA